MFALRTSRALPCRNVKGLLRGLAAVVVPLQVQATWVSTTTVDKEAVAKIAKTLVNKFGTGIDDFRTANIRSYYWWEGAVQDDAEVRGDFRSDLPFAEVRDVIASVHPYDVPMIVSDAPAELLQGIEPAIKYVRGVFEIAETAGSDGTAQRVAKDLVASRLVACAQVEMVSEPEVAARMAVKTIVGHRGEIDQRVRKIAGKGLKFAWGPILANQPYLDWVSENVGDSVAADRASVAGGADSGHAAAAARDAGDL
eukprot:TRINITY_DN62819_c0_g1_i1.p1 TRINITY_DN62819_c0_g1~~TRINITY_DN62819_c0_g1_i1.p1  ORF type:complete len:254 (-),score=42.39 TRINITY_DN62819_c0_g1_i1:147-908(-)